MASVLNSAPNASKPLELVYKEVDGLSIMMDVYIPDDATKENPVPVFWWWHGGGLLQGTRKALATHMLHAPKKHKLCVISADYRLAPQTRLPDILSDCKSAIDFLHTTEFAEATGSRVDGSRLVVSGSSAGGWLALMAGTGIGYEASGLKRPEGIKGVVALYAITDILDPFWTVPQQPVVYLGRLIDKSDVESFLDPDGTKTCWAEAEGKRSFFYPYMLQEGILQSLLLDGTGIEPIKYSIAQNMRTGKFATPPTYVITGNSDTRVPHRQSLDVVEAYKSIGADVEYHELDGLEHNFDKEEGREMESLYDFVKKTL